VTFQAVSALAGRGDRDDRKRRRLDQLANGEQRVLLEMIEGVIRVRGRHWSWIRLAVRQYRTGIANGYPLSSGRRRRVLFGALQGQYGGC
jgi:hypothetical protein